MISKEKSPVTSLDEILVRRSSAKKSLSMLTEDIVPAGKYRTRVENVLLTKTSKDQPAVDVVYRFSNGDFEATAGIRYPVDSLYFEKLCDALIDAGLPEEAPINEAVGIEEDVVVVYPYKGSLGNFSSRKPAKKSSFLKNSLRGRVSTKQRMVAVNDEDTLNGDPKIDPDDEFDNFLSDED